MGLIETELAPLGGRIYTHLVGVVTEKVFLNLGLNSESFFFGLMANAPHLPGVGVSSDRCITSSVWSSQGNLRPRP